MRRYLLHFTYLLRGSRAGWKVRLDRVEGVLFFRTYWATRSTSSSHPPHHHRLPDADRQEQWTRARSAGRLIASVGDDNRRVWRTLAGTVATVADRWQRKRLNSPSKNITRSDGTIP